MLTAIHCVLPTSKLRRDMALQSHVLLGRSMSYWLKAFLYVDTKVVATSKISLFLGYLRNGSSGGQEPFLRNAKETQFSGDGANQKEEKRLFMDGLSKEVTYEIVPIHTYETVPIGSFLG